jgi:hypothetical protein
MVPIIGTIKHINLIFSITNKKNNNEMPPLMPHIICVGREIHESCRYLKKSNFSTMEVRCAEDENPLKRVSTYRDYKINFCICIITFSPYFLFNLAMNIGSI